MIMIMIMIVIVIVIVRIKNNTDSKNYFDNEKLNKLIQIFLQMRTEIKSHLEKLQQNEMKKVN